MTTATAPVSAPPPDVDMEHSSVGLLIKAADKTVKRNEAMTVGDFWRYSVRPLLLEMHKFHIDYTDANGGGPDDAADPEYVDALVQAMAEAKEILKAQTTMLMGAFAALGYLDEKGQIVPDKMPQEVQGPYLEMHSQLNEWAAEYVDLIDESASPPAGATP